MRPDRSSKAPARGTFTLPTSSLASRLTAITVQPNELPGWKAKPYSSDPDEKTEDAEFDSCVGAHNTDNDHVGEGNSPDYSQGDASISSNAPAFRTKDDITNDIAIVHNPKFTR